MKNIEFNDIQNKTYWPAGFVTIANQQQNLVNLQIEFLGKINKGEISVKIEQNKQ